MVIHAALISPAADTDLKSDGRISSPMEGGTSAQRQYGECSVMVSTRNLGFRRAVRFRHFPPYASIAQMAEHLTFNQGVEVSSTSGCTSWFESPTTIKTLVYMGVCRN